MRSRRLAILTLAVLTPGAIAPGIAAGDLKSKISGVASKEGGLRAGIKQDDKHIDAYQGHIDVLQERLNAIESSLAEQRAQLASVQQQLRDARGKLSQLRFDLARDRRLLAKQLVAQYESAPPDMVTVVIQSKGFEQLLETARTLQRIQRHNTDIVKQIQADKKTVTKQATSLAALERQDQAQAAAVLSERDQVARVRLAILNQQLTYRRSKAIKTTKLMSLKSQRSALESQLAKLQQQEAKSASYSYGGSVPPLTGSYTPHGGAYGFFPAAGTNYSVADEPRLAEHLDALGKSLHLHLIGLSGYRTPQHSVEVGGFANDPHTRGQASDTPGVEGVSEATLNRFGLTRPFGGPAEADHIQLVGSI